MCSIKSKILLSISLFIFISGCAKQKEIENSSLTPVVLNKLFDPRYKVKEYIKYKEYDSKNDCNIRIDDDEIYCVNIDSALISIENGSKFIYAVENGTELDKNKEKMTAHMNYGSLKFFKFELLNDNKLKLISESKLLSCGPYGGTCNAVTYKYGNGPELAWIVSTGDVHQGYVGGNLTAYTAFGKKINSFLNIQTGYSNENAVGDDPDASVQSIGTEITTIPNATEKFHDLNITVSGVEVKKKKSSPIDFTAVIKFNSNSNSYQTDVIEKIYEGKEY